MKGELSTAGVRIDEMAQVVSTLSGASKGTAGAAEELGYWLRKLLASFPKHMRRELNRAALTARLRAAGHRKWKNRGVPWQPKKRYPTRTLSSPSIEAVEPTPQPIESMSASRWRAVATRSTRWLTWLWTRLTGWSLTQSKRSDHDQEEAREAQA